MTSVNLMTKADLEERQADIIRRCEPIRAARRPFKCRGQSPCWVTHPFEATGNVRTSCKGCGGLIRGAAPSTAELIAAGLRT